MANEPVRSLRSPDTKEARTALWGAATEEALTAGGVVSVQARTRERAPGACVHVSLVGDADSETFTCKGEGEADRLVAVLTAALGGAGDRG